MPLHVVTVILVSEMIACIPCSIVCMWLKLEFWASGTICEFFAECSSIKAWVNINMSWRLNSNCVVLLVAKFEDGFFQFRLSYLTIWTIRVMSSEQE